MPGPPPRQHKHERRYTPSTHPIHFNKSKMKEYDYDSRMIFGDLMGLKLPDICLTGEVKTRKKNLPQETGPEWELKPGPAA